MEKFNMKGDLSALFETSLRKANQILQVTGLQTDDEESNQSSMERLKNRKYFCLLNLMLYWELCGELAWFLQKGIVENTFIEATYTLPCATLCILGSSKVYYRIIYGHIINDLIHRLRKLQAVQHESDIQTDPVSYEAILKIVRNLDYAIKALTLFNACSVVAFLAGPLIIMAFTYHMTGQLTLRFPFIILYPFDATDMRFYPFVYFLEMIAAIFAVFTIFGPDCLYYLFCTYIQVQFYLLRYDMEQIMNQSLDLHLGHARITYQKKFKACVARHRELMRLTNLINVIYNKSALFNFMTSSLLLCLAGFNVTAYTDLAMLSNFLSFLVMCLLQIYLICYYGDNVSQSSVAISSAVYNSQWYKLDAKMAKDWLLILTRAQKPCKLTAYNFIDINLTAFTRTLSNSWSYFALLQSVYKKDTNIN